MDIKALLLTALQNPALRMILAPMLQAAAAVALRALADQIEKDPTMIAKLLDQLAAMVPKDPK
jgi:hypothetical protein